MTAKKVGPYGGKKLDVLCETFAQSLDAGHNVGVPVPRASVIASQIAKEMLDFAAKNAPPPIGSRDEMQRILAYRHELRHQSQNTHPSVSI